jgi:hypothetical protein
MTTAYDYVRGVPKRSQEDIHQRRQMAAAYYVLRAFRSAEPWILWWTSLTWEQQESER